MLYNLSVKVCFMIRIKKATTFKEKLIGLMGEKHINYGIFFYNTRSIHTFFMKDEIDVIGINNKMQVTEIFPYVRPNHILLLRKSKHTLELPKGYSKNYKIGNKVQI